MRFIVVVRVLIFLLSICVGQVSPSRTLPANLRRCYTNDGNFVPALPLNLQVILDVLRKIERSTRSTLPLRGLSLIVLKRFKLDGIVYAKNLPRNPDVLNYVARGAQRAKNLIVEQLLPAGGVNLDFFNDDLLNDDEYCLLHFALSNTIWRRWNDDEETFCRPLADTEARMIRSNNAAYYGSGRSLKKPVEDDDCPKESGVVLTDYNTVSLGTIVSAIAAALEPQIVDTRLLLNNDDDGDSTTKRSLGDKFDYENNEDVDVLGTMSGDRSMWLRTVSVTGTQIDNVWMATLAGELAELVVYQGPLYENNVYLGATGYWNNTIVPRIFYFSQNYDHYDVTRAEIVGGIDGLVIAKNLDKLLRRFGNLRLSQILDMYYSDEGIVFDKNLKACKRADNFPNLAPKSTLEEQTYAASQVLAYLNSIAAMSDAALQSIVNDAVDNFARYTEQSVFAGIQCREEIKKNLPPRLEFFVAFDGSWTRDYTANFLAVLVQDLDVSIYGSRMGLINGETGEWLMNVTNSSSDAHRAINKLNVIQWPVNTKLHHVFETVLSYMDDFWNAKQKNRVVGDIGQAVVLLATRTTMIDADVERALVALKNIKARHPELYFIYYTCDSRLDLFKRFVLSDEDKIVRTLNIDDITRLLAEVPKTLRPVGCNPNIPGVRLQLEDYVNPRENNLYRLHTIRKIKGKKVVVTLHGVGYGSMRVCWWNKWNRNNKRLTTYCKTLTHHDDIALDDYNVCDDNGNCPDTYVEISNVTSFIKCAEFDCRSPEQVRYIVRMENFQCSGGNVYHLNLLLITLIVIFFIVF